MADWAADIKKYDPKADDAIVAAMEKTYALVLSNRDAALVSFGDAEEVVRVHENFISKKLGVTDKAKADAAMKKVEETMKADRTKNRLTVYYLLAKELGKLSVFGK